MAQKTLRDVLTPRTEDTGAFRWHVTVPIGTNPFLLLDVFQFAFAGGVIVLLTLCTGVWFMEGGITIMDIYNSIEAAGLVTLAVMAGFIGMAALFFGNRYYATYHMDSGGIYHEGTRGQDERKGLFCLQFRSFPVIGAVISDRTRSRCLTWDKVDRFQDITPMRVVILRRGFWHMLRLYTPDAETHDKVVQYLAEERCLRRI